MTNREILLNIDSKNINDELFFRQFSPKFWMQDGIWSNLTFEPTKAHDYKLSTSRSSLCTDAKTAFEFHTKTKKLDSAGTWAVSAADVNAEQLGIFQKGMV